MLVAASSVVRRCLGVLMVGGLGLCLIPSTTATAQDKDHAAAADDPEAEVRSPHLPPLPDTLWYKGTGRGGLKGWDSMRMGTIKALADKLNPAIVRVEVRYGSGRNQGSAFFINPEGYALTNQHVVRRATHDITVRMRDGSERIARVVGRDPITDLALIFVEARPGEKFSFVRIAKGRLPEPGEWVMTLGAPLRFDNTVTVGIVSGVRRRGSRPKKPNEMRSYIQFDSAINPGSSGGALFDMRGEVVGVVTAMRKDGQGLGFAVPIDRVLRVLPRLADGQVISRSWLGADVQRVDFALARSLGLERPMGALVRSVDDGSPASLADLRIGDVILSFDGQTLRDYADLPWLVATSEPDRPIRGEIWRDDKRHKVVFTLIDASGRSSPASRSLPNVTTHHGVAAMTLTTELARALELPVRKGALVYHVDDDSRAQRAGLGPRMVVTQVDDTPIESGDALETAIDAAMTDTGAVRLLVHDSGGPRWIAFEVAR